MRLNNETAIITGSTSGIGKKLAEIFLKEGCKVAICSGNEDNVNKTLVKFKKRFGDSVIGFVCNVNNPLELKELVEKTKNTFGSIRILIANAGLNLTYGPFNFLTLEKVNNDAKMVIGTNLIGVMNSIAAVIPQMRKQGYGRIVTLSGGGADRPIEHMTIYSASKGGVTAFSRCLAEELKKEEEDIKINIFQPGMIKTNLIKGSSVIKEWKDEKTYKEELDLVMKYVATDIEESCNKVLPYVLPNCKDNGKTFRGFSIRKLISGFRKIRKIQKKQKVENS